MLHRPKLRPYLIRLSLFEFAAVLKELADKSALRFNRLRLLDYHQRQNEGQRGERHRDPWHSQ